MRVLVINPGSSTVKFELFQDLHSSLTHLLDKYDVGESVFDKPVSYIKRHISSFKSPLTIDAIGVRVVHGGKQFKQATLVTEKVLNDIDRLSSLAPLHNPRSVTVIRECFEEYPNIPVIAVFDTQFHTTLLEKAKKYPVPPDIADRYNIEKYGFHGTSHRYMYERALEQQRQPADAMVRAITCHLGSGASLCAIKDGHSVDTTMGMTPLDGLMMTTRCGHIDPAIIFHLAEQGLALSEIKTLLEKQSGLLGVYGKSHDMREVILNRHSDDKASLAFEMYIYRVQLYIGAYVAALEGLDFLTFGAGIGESSPLVRQEVCRSFGYLGLKLDDDLNNMNFPGMISARDSKVAVLIVKTHEELAIAQMAEGVLENRTET